jgi:hypothetical protein
MKRTEARTRTVVTVGAIAVTTALMLVLPAIALTTTAFAQQPENPECWGTVSSQAATSEGSEFGEHASGQEEPRQGIGNLADHPSELGTFLASVDENPETQCP